MIIDRCTLPMDLFSQEIYDLFGSGCARVPNPSFDGHHAFCIKQLDYAPSGKLTLAQSMLLHVHRDHKDCQGRGAQDGHLDFHPAPELCSLRVGEGWAGGGYKLGP